MTKELLTVDEFTEQYSISRTALYREVNAGRLTLTKQGRNSRIKRKDAEAWANDLPHYQPAA